MPTYEYQCEACGRKVEYFQYISEAPVTECPTCHGHLSRLVSAGVGLIFKGSGFYITDYKKSNGSVGSPSKPKGEPESGTASPTTETKTTESKPAESTTSTESK